MGNIKIFVFPVQTVQKTYSTKSGATKHGQNCGKKAAAPLPNNNDRVMALVGEVVEEARADAVIRKDDWVNRVVSEVVESVRNEQIISKHKPVAVLVDEVVEELHGEAQEVLQSEQKSVAELMADISEFIDLSEEDATEVESAVEIIDLVESDEVSEIVDLEDSAVRVEPSGDEEDDTVSSEEIIQLREEVTFQRLMLEAVQSGHPDYAPPMKTLKCEYCPLTFLHHISLRRHQKQSHIKNTPTVPSVSYYAPEYTKLRDPRTANKRIPIPPRPIKPVNPRLLKSIQPYHSHSESYLYSASCCPTN